MPPAIVVRPDPKKESPFPLVRWEDGRAEQAVDGIVQRACEIFHDLTDDERTALHFVKYITAPEMGAFNRFLEHHAYARDLLVEKNLIRPGEGTYLVTRLGSAVAALLFFPPKAQR